MLELVTAPSVAPVSLSDLKAHLRIDHDDEDAYLQTLALVATASVEEYCQSALVEQTWRWVLGAWPSDGDRFPLSPVIAIEEIAYLDEDEAEQTLAVESFEVVGAEDPMIYVASDVDLPSLASRPNAVKVTFTAGHQAESGDEFPAIASTILHAIKLTAGHLYENREAVLVGVAAEELPLGVKSLLARHRVWR